MDETLQLVEVSLRAKERLREGLLAQQRIELYERVLARNPLSAAMAPLADVRRSCRARLHAWLSR